jgi:hypothetical protein
MEKSTGLKNGHYDGVMGIAVVSWLGRVIRGLLR